MKITAFFHGILHKDQIILRVNDVKDLVIIKKMFSSKVAREERSNKEILLKCEIDAAFQKRSFKQNNAVWALIDVIFESDNKRKPTDEEKYELYLDLLELYADKRPSRFTGNLVSVHISKANTVQGSNFIDGLLYHISTQCQISYDLQSTVRSVLYEWEIWRGKQDIDINDDKTVEELREKLRYSEASGNMPVELHHIVTRGADSTLIDKAWNLIALTHDEHMELHKKGWKYFLEKYPHLKGRIQRVFDKAGHLPIPDNYESLENNDVKLLAEQAFNY